MKKSELKTGHITKARNGGYYIVVKDTFDHEDKFINIDEAGFMRMSSYEENLKYNEGSKAWDMIAVWQPCYIQRAIGEMSKIKERLGDSDYFRVIWAEDTEQQMKIDKLASLVNDLQNQLTDAKKQLKELKGGK